MIIIIGTLCNAEKHPFLLFLHFLLSKQQENIREKHFNTKIVSLLIIEKFIISKK